MGQTVVGRANRIVCLSTAHAHGLWATTNHEMGVWQTTKGPVSKRPKVVRNARGLFAVVSVVLQLYQCCFSFVACCCCFAVVCSLWKLFCSCLQFVAVACSCFQFVFQFFIYFGPPRDKYHPTPELPTQQPHLTARALQYSDARALQCSAPRTFLRCLLIFRPRLRSY